MMKYHFTFPMSGRLTWVKTCSTCRPSDAQPLRPRVEGQGGVEERPGDHERREQVGQNSHVERDGEALDRAGPVAVEEQPRDQGGAVAVDDGVERPVEPGVDRGLDGPTVPQLLADALEHEHVRVYRHADRQRE